MTQHLPECNQRETVWQKAHYSGVECICDALRACEQRMLDDDVLAAAHHGQKGYEIGFRKGLDAAREAVETVWTDDPSWDGTNWNNALYEALAAIDALKEKQ